MIGTHRVWAELSGSKASEIEHFKWRSLSFLSFLSKPQLEILLPIKPPYSVFKHLCFFLLCFVLYVSNDLDPLGFESRNRFYKILNSPLLSPLTLTERKFSFFATWSLRKSSFPNKSCYKLDFVIGSPKEDLLISGNMHPQ